METQLTINDYINQLFADKHSLVLKLQENWIDEAVDSLTFTQLVPFIGTELTRILNIDDHVNDAYSAASGFDYSTAINLGSYMINRYPAEIKVTSNVTNLSYFAARLVGKAPKIITQGNAVTNFSNMYSYLNHSNIIDCTGLDMTNATNTNLMFSNIQSNADTDTVDPVHVPYFKIQGDNTKIKILRPTNSSQTGSNWYKNYDQAPFYSSFKYTDLVDLSGLKFENEIKWLFTGRSYTYSTSPSSGEWICGDPRAEFASKKIIMDVTNVTRMERVFDAYNNFHSSSYSQYPALDTRNHILDLSEWYTPNLTECVNLFGCCKFNRIDIRNFDFTHCANTISFSIAPGNVYYSGTTYNYGLNNGTVFIIKDDTQREHLRTHLSRFANYTFYTVEEWEALQNG